MKHQGIKACGGHRYSSTYSWHGLQFQVTGQNRLVAMPRGESPSYVDRKLSAPQRESTVGGEEKISCPCREWKSGPPAHRLFTVRTDCAGSRNVLLYRPFASILSSDENKLWSSLLCIFLQPHLLYLC